MVRCVYLTPELHNLLRYCSSPGLRGLFPLGPLAVLVVLLDEAWPCISPHTDGFGFGFVKLHTWYPSGRMVSS